MRILNREKVNNRSFRTKFDIVRSANTPDDLIIEGYFALYEQETELFADCFEIISRGAFKNIKGKDIRALWNHNSQYVLGRTTNGTLELEEDDKGLFGRVRLPNTTYAKDLYEIIKRGDLDQCSFGFEIVDEELEELANDKYRWRINEINLFEVSCVTFPAYENTNIEARMSDFEKVQKRKLEIIKNNLKKRLEAIRC